MRRKAKKRRRAGIARGSRRADRRLPRAATRITLPVPFHRTPVGSGLPAWRRRARQQRLASSALGVAASPQRRGRRRGRRAPPAAAARLPAAALLLGPQRCRRPAVGGEEGGLELKSPMPRKCRRTGAPIAKMWCCQAFDGMLQACERLTSTARNTNTALREVIFDRARSACMLLQRPCSAQTEIHRHTEKSPPCSGVLLHPTLSWKRASAKKPAIAPSCSPDHHCIQLALASCSIGVVALPASMCALGVSAAALLQLHTIRNHARGCQQQRPASCCKQPLLSAAAATVDSARCGALPSWLILS